jgi:GNAT superfamily N-acetyltransferase
VTRSAAFALSPFVAIETADLATRVASLDPWRTLGVSAEAIARYLVVDDPALRREVVRVGEDAAGVVSVRSPWLRGPFIELLAIFPAFARRGLGRSVVESIADRARAESANLWVTVSSFNAAARAFYSATGFFEVAVLPDLVARGFDEVLLRLPLRG